jgi:hypothetical protein
MTNLKFSIQLPSGQTKPLPLTDGEEVVFRLVSGTDFMPELVVALIIEARTPDGQRITITIPPIPDIDVVVELQR